MRTFSDGKNIYSVDMMIAYINIFKPKSVKISIEKNNLFSLLEDNCWGDFSPMDVLNNPKKKKYKEDYIKIKKANLDYPIIVYNGNIIDGMHRLSKLYLLKKNEVKAYNFDKNLMKKFLIGKSDKIKSDKINNIEKSILIERFVDKFINNIQKIE